MELPARDQALEADVSDVFSIGGMNAPEWALFGRVASLDFDGNGTLYVHDLQNNRIAADWVVPDNLGFLKQIGVISTAVDMTKNKGS